VAKKPVRKISQRRLLEHRKRPLAARAKRVAVTVPAQDVQVIRDLAEALRAGGKRAIAARSAARPVVKKSGFRSGRELLEFFQNSPLAEVDLYLERDKSTGRPVDL